VTGGIVFGAQGGASGLKRSAKGLRLAAGAVLVVTAIAFARPAPAEEEGRPTAEQRALAERYVAALRAQDMAALQALFDPNTSSCIDDGNRAVAEASLRAHFAQAVPDDYTVSVYPVDDGKTPKWLRGLTRTVVPPTHQLQVSFTRDGQTSILPQPMAHGSQGWRFVMLCPTERGVLYYETVRKDPKAARELRRQWMREDGGQ